MPALRYGKNGTRVCVCGHYLSAHRYTADREGRTTLPPSRCAVPDCACEGWKDRRMAVHSSATRIGH